MQNHMVSELDHSNETRVVFPYQEAKKTDTEVPGTAIAEVQLQLYNQDHLFSNRNMGMSTDLTSFQNGSLQKKGSNGPQEVFSELKWHY